MSSSRGIKIVMGGTGLLRSKPAPEVPQLLSVLTTHHVNTIDSAVIYGDSEEVLGLNNAGGKFTIDTKLPGGFRPGSGTKDGVIQTGQESLSKLKVKQVDVLYVHAPDTSVPFEETLQGLDELYKQGMFRRLGLSNFKLEQIQEVCEICEAKEYVMPSVYQGNYNAFARSYESKLIPYLRERKMSFHAYSPQAGGFLSKTKELINAAAGGGEGRFLGNEGATALYKTMYKKPALLEGLTKWNEIATRSGINPGDMAVRWVRYNSALKPEFGDALIIGGRTIEQVEQTLTTLAQGPLSDNIATQIDEVWEMVENEAPVDNYHDFAQQTVQGK